MLSKGTLALPFSSKGTTVSTPSTITLTLPVAFGMLISTVALSPALMSLGMLIETLVSCFPGSTTVKSREVTLELNLSSPM